MIDDSLKLFKDWCGEAFRFLITEYNFRELNELHPKHSNPYQVRFSNGIIELVILGEGYGSDATIEFISTGGVEVAYEILALGWEPFKKRKIKQSRLSQKDQIFYAAEVVRNRDKDILHGDYTRLNTAAERWQEIKQKMGWNK